ncbi:MAG TPA: hypothetical protein VKN99_24570 [Polyangia bacterium]|nr:hypothetical protein [Polyangia bacterium]
MWSRLCAAALAVAACTVDTQKYDNQLYTCDVASADSSACGAGYGCYGAARPLGAPDFCAPTCDPGQPDPAGSVCSEGSALRKCSPSLSGQCASGMACIRTDLLTDEGVCLPISACARNEDCRDPIRSECFSQEMLAVYVNRRADLKTDALFCIQPGCLARFEACAPGTACLPVVLGRGLPDVCTPSCDAKKRCPPNFVCSSKFLPSQADPFCVPGLLGFRCNSRLDCMLGDCEMVVSGHKVCTTPCTVPADCASYDNGNFLFPAAFTCMGGRCLSPTLVLLELCQLAHPEIDCAAGDACVTLTPDTPSGLGICVTPCPASRICPPKGGFPQSCFDTPLGSYCVIGIFGVPCNSNQDCVNGLQCLTPSNLLPYKLCSTPCQSHADCTNNHLVGTSSYCMGVVYPSEPKVCVPKLDGGKPCLQNVQCKSNQCQCDVAPCTVTNPGHCTAVTSTTIGGP